MNSNIVEDEEDNESLEAEESFWKRYCKCKYTSKEKVFIVTATWGFLTGVERAIILPTLWLYFMTAFNKAAAQQYYGITLSVFNVAIFVISPIYGYLAYKGIRVKALLILSNQLEIVGNIIYFLANQPWLVFFGRFISGLGAGSQVPLFGDIVRMTTKEERTKYIITIMMAQQVGLIIGPACTIIMHPLKYDKGSFHLDVYNAPGLFMSILWSMHTILVLLTYPQLTRNGKEDNYDGATSNGKKIRSMIYAPQTGNDATDNSPSADKKINEQSELVEKPKPEGCCAGIRSTFSLNSLKPYVRYQPATLLIGLFSAYLCLMSLEAVLPPLGENFFKWTELESSYVYLGCGIFVIIVFAVLRFLTNYFNDKHLLLVGHIALIIGYSHETITIALTRSDQPVLFITLILLGVGLHVIGLPFVIASESLFTKSVEDCDSDHSQTVLRTVINLAFIVGPYLGGSLQSYPSIVFAIMLALVLIPGIMLVARFDTFDY